MVTGTSPRLDDRRPAAGRRWWRALGVALGVALALAGATLSTAPAHAGGAQGGSWALAGRLSTDRTGATATLLADATVVVAGGGTPEVASAEVFDPATGTWSPTGSMGTARSLHAAVRLPDGRVLVSGGAVGSNALSSAEIYNPISRTWAPTAAMAVSRQGHTATVLAGGKVLVVGGLGGGHGPYRAEAELFDPATGTWAPTGALAQGRAHHSATLLADGRVLVVGGEADTHGDSVRDAVVYDPVAGSWSPVPRLMSVGRADHTATALPDGTVLVAGGTKVYIGGRPENVLASTELLDRSGQAFLPAPAMAQRRDRHTATALPDGRVLVSGGKGDQIATPTATAEIYDPAARRWKAATPMPGSAAGHNAVLVSGSGCSPACGKVLVVGERAAYLFTPPPAGSAGPSRVGSVVGGLGAGAVAVLAASVGVVVSRRRRRGAPAGPKTTSRRGTTQTLEHR